MKRWEMRRESFIVDVRQRQGLGESVRHGVKMSLMKTFSGTRLTLEKIPKITVEMLTEAKRSGA